VTGYPNPNARKYTDVCCVPGCGRPFYALDRCHSCYNRFNATRDPDRPPRRTAKRNPAVIERVRSLAQTHTQREIAKIVGIARSTVRAVIRANGIRAMAPREAWAIGWAKRKKRRKARRATAPIPAWVPHDLAAEYRRRARRCEYKAAAWARETKRKMEAPL
jgi:hypothetical protein